MSFFNILDYRIWIKEAALRGRKSSRGELSKIAKALKIHTSQLSQILQGQRDLTMDQAFEFANYFELTHLEQEYFLTLVQIARSSHFQFKEYGTKKLQEIRSRAEKPQERYKHEKVLSEVEKSIFYSHPFYSAIRLFCSIKESGVQFHEIQERFTLKREQLSEIINFLLSCGLIKQYEGNYVIGPTHTFLPSSSVHIHKHHSNWRVQAIHQSPQLTEQELMFTAPMSISKGDFQKIKQQLLSFIQDANKTIQDSPAEEIACLNIDLFWVK